MDDLATVLVDAEVDGEKLSELEFQSFFLLLAIAGNETTRTVTSQGMRLLSEHPQIRSRVVGDMSLLPHAVEEILRYNPAVMHFRRTASEDCTIRGKRIRKGEKVVTWYPSANRDEDVYVDADRFDIDRWPNDHLAFGVGEHFCLGASLARVQLTSIFEEILTRLPDIEVEGPVRYLRSNFIDGIKEMRVRFTPETQRRRAVS
jgi:cytochrome P450